MRADAEKNRRHLLSAARETVTEHGAEASLREIARRAEVSLPTLYRHFPTREALLEALLHDELNDLVSRATLLEATHSPGDAIARWFGEALLFTRTYNGVVALMAEAMEDEQSALHRACAQVKAVGERLLQRAQAAGAARNDVVSADLFALMGALSWIGEQPSFQLRTDILAEMIIDMIIRRNDISASN